MSSKERTKFLNSLIKLQCKLNDFLESVISFDLESILECGLLLLCLIELRTRHRE